MIDLHCHILPGIDDGARDMEEALSLARIMVADGISVCVATPHIYPGRYDNDIASIRNTYESFCAALEAQEIPLSVRMAAEVRLSPELLRWIPEGRIPFLGKWEDRNVLLLELPDGHIPPGTENFIAWLLKRRVQPLIAHPERNKAVMRDVAKIEPLVEMGCLLQITAASVTGAFGETVRSAADYLMAQDWVFAVATDTHNMRHRPPVLQSAKKKIVSIHGIQYADTLCLDNPASLFGDR